MQLNDALRQLEAKFPPETCPLEPLAPTGEPFITIASGGEKPDGEIYPVLCATREVAVQTWYDAVLRHAEGKGKRPILYWRERPEIIVYHITMADERGTHRLTANRYTVRSRLVIGKKVKV